MSDLTDRDIEILDSLREEDFYAGVLALVIAALAPAKPASEVVRIVDSVYKDVAEYYEDEVA